MKNDWEKKATCLGLPIKQNLCHFQCEFGYVALPSVRSNDPTDPLHISGICSIWKILHFYSSFSLNPSKSPFFHALTLSLPTCCLLFLNSVHAKLEDANIEMEEHKIEMEEDNIPGDEDMCTNYYTQIRRWESRDV